MTDPKVIADALEAVLEVAWESGQPPAQAGGYTYRSSGKIDRARAAIAALRADAAPVSTESTPDDLPNVWTVVVRGTDTVMHYGTNRAEAESRAALMRDGDGEYDAVEYVPRARLDATLKERDEARAALDKAVAAARDDEQRNASLAVQQARADEREAIIRTAREMATEFRQQDCPNVADGCDRVADAAAIRARGAR